MEVEIVNQKKRTDEKMEYTIRTVIDKDERYNVITGKAIPYLTYRTPSDGEKVLSVGGAEASLEELVELCDHDAENINAHDYCGAHRLLGAVLFRSIGRFQAERVMLEIARRGGLHSMAGVCGRDDSFAELGVGEAGHDWSGRYK